MSDSTLYGQVVEVYVPGIQGPQGARGATGSVTAALQTLHDEAQSAAATASAAASAAASSLSTMQSTGASYKTAAETAAAQAAASASTASSKATTATTKASQAASSASQAASSATAADTAMTNAMSAASRAGGSETNAASSATAAAASAAQAASSAAQASTAEAGANAAVTSAATSATAAAASAQAAATSENTAATAAVNASTYASTAQTQASISGQYAALAMAAAEKVNSEDILKQPDWQQWDTTAPDYIKNRTHYDTYTVTESREDVFESDTFTSDPDTGYGPLSEYFTLDPKEEYIVTYDGTEYRDVGAAFLYQAGGWCGKPIEGSPDYEDYPFGIYPRPCEDYTVVFTEDPGNHTIQVEKVTKVATPSGVQQIDPKYLPVNALQTDWRETSTTSLKYLQNKPVISYDANTQTLYVTGWASW